MSKPFILKERECPICGKLFYPYPEHIYIDKRHKAKNDSDKILVCSYSCMRYTEKENTGKYYMKVGL